jgi:hypothetical protein
MKRQQSEPLSNTSEISEIIDKSASSGINISSSTALTNDDVFYDCRESRVLSTMALERTFEKRDNVLKFASIMSVIFVYIQMTTLLYILGLTTVKLGLLFMLICVMAIGYMTLKVCLLNIMICHVPFN